MSSISNAWHYTWLTNIDPVDMDRLPLLLIARFMKQGHDNESRPRPSFIVIGAVLCTSEPLTEG